MPKEQRRRRDRHEYINFQLRLLPQDARDFQELAAKDTRSASSLLRKITRQYIEQQRAAQPEPAQRTA
jgi:hypothetical protein